MQIQSLLKSSQLMNPISESIAYNFNHLRALLFTLESLPLPLIHRMLSGKTSYRPTSDEIKAVLQHGRKLLKQDAIDFAENSYPAAIYLPSEISSHFSTLLKVIVDGAKSSWRQRRNLTKEFSKKSDKKTDFPDYYIRNFHFQTDGYLSEESAELYEHQVELLFRGMAEPMRRRLLPPMKAVLPSKAPLKILELGCGTGTFTRSLALTFPEAQITAVDMSPSYIKRAKSRFLRQKNIHFITANAEDLPFKDQQFDAVVSVFLHHELPEKARSKVIGESLRVLKPLGFWGLLDALQAGDVSELDWTLREFPKMFHEPFFKNYISTPLKDLVAQFRDEEQLRQQTHFFSKVVTFSGSDFES